MAASFSSPDLRTLRERLLKQVVGSSSAAAAKVPKAKPNLKKAIFADRTYLTNNFILNTTAQNKEVSGFNFCIWYNQL